MSEASERVRAGVILLDGDRLAVIRRRRDGRLYHVLPGGGIEHGESPEDAARREVKEELGVDVDLLGSIGTVTFVRGDGSRYHQHYFAARVIGGAFGTGLGPEFDDDGDPGRGTYEPIWLDVADAVAGEVYPKPLLRALDAVGVDGLLSAPVALVDDGR